jgi:predicted O-linked N-acetylglucosamine transferase (SPINDLY family)
MKRLDLTSEYDRVAFLLEHGLNLHRQGKLKKAKVVYEKVLNLQPNHFDALQFLGVLSIQEKQLIHALRFLSRALKINQKNADCYCNHGNVLQELGRFEEAISSYRQAILIKPDAETYYNLGKALKGLSRLEEANISYYNAISDKPNFTEAYFNRGLVLQELGRFEEALASYDNAISINPLFVDAYYNKGNTLQELGRFDEAIASYDNAIRLKPNYAESYINCGNALHQLRYLEDAIIRYNVAIKLNPNNADAFYNRGNSLQELQRFDEALESYDKFGEIKKDHDFVLDSMQYLRMSMANWTNWDHQKKALLQKIDSSKNFSNPFLILALVDSLLIHRNCSTLHYKEKYTQGSIHKTFKKNKIRVGYFSADFYNHATAYLMAELFELHDKNQFEIYAFSFGFSVEDKMQNRLKGNFDKFLDVSEKSDISIAKLSRELEIDIAIDLKGSTAFSRTGIFACRAAPVQVNYLGYPGTMAVDFIDYIIADKTLIPAESKKYYAEKIIYLPDSYQVNDRKKIISDKQFSRAELELPENSFVFCCFNNNFKIQPSTFDGWMRILKAVQGSVLWLLQDNEFASKNLKKEAQERGVEASRLVFAKRHPLEEHLARHRQADLFIDTFPYNAHTTASDALWAGLPVLTLMGESFASRVAASLLTAIDLPELITSTQEHYEALAIELATNPAKLKAIKTKLEANRLTTPLFDTPRFTKHLEEAYAKMYERYHADLPPDHIYI